MLLCVDILRGNSKRHLFLGSSGCQGNKPKQATAQRYGGGTQRQGEIERRHVPRCKEKLRRNLQTFKGMELVEILVNGTNPCLNFNDLKGVLKLTKDQKTFYFIIECF